MNRSADGNPAAPHAAHHAELLRLARDTIAHHLATGGLLAYKPVHDRLREPAAVFVTLRVRDRRDDTGKGGERWEAGDLRGCIGQVEAESPLYLAVQDAAVKAATTDPRFYPVRLDELANLVIEISVLSPMRPVESLNSIVIGQDGLLIIGNHRRGLLLPEVPLAYGWGREEFVRALCHKAGLPEDAWPGHAWLYAFTTESFEE